MAKDNKTLHLVLKRKWWDFLQARYPGIRKAEGKQLKFIFNL